jgi:L-rhamnose isomerase
MPFMIGMYHLSYKYDIVIEYISPYYVFLIFIKCFYFMSFGLYGFMCLFMIHMIHNIHDP